MFVLMMSCLCWLSIGSVRRLFSGVDFMCPMTYR
jgi:hypothetical protein